MSGRPWTETDIATVARMRAEDVPDAQIATAIDRTTASIKTMIQTLRKRGEAPHIERRVRATWTRTHIAQRRENRKKASTWTPDRVSEAQKLVAEGSTVAQVARRLGTTSKNMGRMLMLVANGVGAEHAPEERNRLDRTTHELYRVAREVEQARAVLRRAEQRYEDAMQPFVAVVRQALTTAGLEYGLLHIHDECSDPAHDFLEALRKQGYAIVGSSEYVT